MTFPTGLNLVIAILTFAAFIIPLKELITNNNGKISEKGWFLLIAGIAILILTCVKSSIDETKNEEDSKLTRKVDSMQRVINSKQTIIEGKQNKIDSKQDIIDQKQNVINSQNDTIYYLQWKIVDTTQFIARQTSRNSELQKELLRQANSSKSFPLIEASITGLTRTHFEYYRNEANEGPVRLLFSLRNIGKYDVNHIKVKYFTTVEDHVEESKTLGEFNLSDSETIEIKDTLLEYVRPFIDSYGYNFTVSWKNYHYSFTVILPKKRPITNGKPQTYTKDSMRQIYRTNGRPFEDKDKFINAVLNEIE